MSRVGDQVPDLKKGLKQSMIVLSYSLDRQVPSEDA